MRSRCDGATCNAHTDQQNKNKIAFAIVTVCVCDGDRWGSKNRAHLINMPNLVLATTLNRCPETWACLLFLLLLFCLLLVCLLNQLLSLSSIVVYRIGCLPMQSCNWHLSSSYLLLHRLDKFDQPPPALAMSALAWILGNDIIHVRLVPHLHLQFST